MKISLSWLRDYIDINATRDELSDILTSLGLEVEGMEEVEAIPGGLKGLVVGHVQECERHPNADRLSLTIVNIGQEESLQIVCGAPNVKKGQKVVVAPVGTILYPTGGDPFQIKKGKIRGEVSQGMICAEDEIGLGSDHEGIMILPDDVEIGSAVADYFGIETDTVYDIGLTPNRSDAMSHLGVARDLAAYFKVNTEHDVEVRYPKIDGLKTNNSTSAFPVEVKSYEGCPRFTGVSISNLKIAESPEWIKKRLQTIGVRSINNVVDITNYVLHEYGQPLHAYDLKKVGGNQIEVKTLPNGTHFKSLDEVDRKLRSEDLIVCDGNGKGMCIAGIFGGMDSGVSESTKDIFLEGAYWNPSWIRRTSTYHNLRTDAAKCFEKGADPNKTLDAVKRAAFLMQEYADGQISSPIVDIYPEKIEKKCIEVNIDNVRKLIGNNLAENEIEKILHALNIEISSKNGTVYSVLIPTDKSDVLREADVTEEILRIYGFNKVQIDNKLSTTITTSNYPELYQFRNQLADFLVGKGFREVMGLSLVPSSYFDKDSDQSKEQLVRINNTSNVYLDILRPSMLHSGMESIRYNFNRQQKDLRLFEIGKSYLREQTEYNETEHLCIYITGAEEGESWLSPDGDSSFYTIKKITHEILGMLSIHKYKSSDTKSKEFDYGREYHLGEKNIAKFGKVSSKLLKEMEIKGDVHAAQFDLNTLFLKKKRQRISVKEISKFPTIRRDLSLTMDRSVSFESIVNCVRGVERKLIKEINLFDVYNNEEQLGPGKKSYAISLIFEDHAKTLNDKQVDKSIGKITTNLAKELGCQIR